MLILKAAKMMEEQVDDEIKNLETLDEDGIEAINRRRLGNLGSFVDKLFCKWGSFGLGV